MSAVTRLFLDGSGRSGRVAFLLAAGALLAGLAGWEAAPAGARRWTGWLVGLLLAFSACAVTSRRLHDRGRSGWWTALALLAFVNVWPAPRGAVGWLFASVLLAALVDLGLLPSQPRFNRYGPQPRAPWPTRAPSAAATAR